MPKIHAKRICVIRLSALGDIVHTLGLVNGLRKGYPDAHLTWLLQPIPYDMVKNQTAIDSFIVFDRKGGMGSWKKVYDQLKNEQFDLILMLQVSIKASMLSLFVKGKVKLGFDLGRSREMHWLFANERIPFHEPQHVQDQFFEFLDYLGILDYPKDWSFRFTDEELAYRKFFFRDLERMVISFVIASSNPEKDWHPKNYADVIDYVENDLNMQPMIIGGPSNRERLVAEEICGYCQSRPVIALEKPIRRTMLQLSGSRIVISPDTGPLHMAIGMNVPTIGLYGYSDPRRCGPYRYRDLLIDKYNDSGDENLPITRVTKKGRMEQITPQEVIDKIDLALERY